VSLHCGDSLEWLRTLPDASVDAVVSDPPAGIAFMNAAWDRDKGGRDAWIAWLCEVMREVWRVTKPGGHALVWALPRTQHWTATAVEDAGWEVRDVLMHVFGSGFPKSLDVSKKIDEMAGATREVVGKKRGVRGADGTGHERAMPGKATGIKQVACDVPVTAPATDDAKRWAGWGTALKPSHEAWILARKPLSGTVAANVLQHGTGALNIDGCRVGTDETLGRTNNGREQYNPSSFCMATEARQRFDRSDHAGGRWPPHLLLTHAAACGETCADGCPVAEMDGQSGVSKSTGGSGEASMNPIYSNHTVGTYLKGHRANMGGLGDTGGASRFFPVFRYVAKPSTAEKTCAGTVENRHPTAKSIALMRWLVRLITPPGGVVLDPFLGSGTTGVAAVSEGHAFMGCDLSSEFVAVARQRIEHAMAGVGIEQTGEAAAAPEPKNGQISMW
jgi:site-specific DNA-methyltransferase (adenine-specific)